MVTGRKTWGETRITNQGVWEQMMAMAGDRGRTKEDTTIGRTDSLMQNLEK